MVIVLPTVLYAFLFSFLFFMYIYIYLLLRTLSFELNRQKKKTALMHESENIVYWKWKSKQTLYIVLK